MVAFYTMNMKGLYILPLAGKEMKKQYEHIIQLFRIKPKFSSSTFLYHIHVYKCIN